VFFWASILSMAISWRAFIIGILFISVRTHFSTSLPWPQPCPFVFIGNVLVIDDEVWTAWNGSGLLSDVGGSRFESDWALERAL
jgi:hypothetical protein